VTPAAVTPGAEPGSGERPEADLVLVGAPGSGKSSVGVAVARRLRLPFFDVDAVIEERAGKTVRDIFADEGEPAFRAVEVDTTLELLQQPGVLSLGGGAVTSEAIREALRGHRVVWLRVSAGQAARRVGLTEARPLLLGNVRGQLVRLLAQRTPLYEAVATHTVDTDDADLETVVEQVAAVTRQPPAEGAQQ
jgi:shikimate kinase